MVSWKAQLITINSVRVVTACELLTMLKVKSKSLRAPNPIWRWDIYQAATIKRSLLKAICPYAECCFWISLKLRASMPSNSICWDLFFLNHDTVDKWLMHRGGEAVTRQRNGFTGCKMKPSVFPSIFTISNIIKIVGINIEAMITFHSIIICYIYHSRYSSYAPPFSYYVSVEVQNTLQSK